MIDKINGNGVYDFPGSQKRKNPVLKAYENTPGTKDAAKRKAGTAHGSAKASGSGEQGVILDLTSKASAAKGNAAQHKKSPLWTDVLRRLFAPVVRWMKDFWESDSPKKTDTGVQSQEDSILETGEQNADGDETLRQAEDRAEANAEKALPEEANAEKALAEAVLAEKALAVEDTEKLPPLEEAVTDREIQKQDHLHEINAIARKAARSGDLKQIERLLTENGTKRLAHNSDLLTYYDRRGKIVEMDETEKFRVLFGDKNVLKL